MALFRKRPMIVDAEQWFPGRSVRGVQFTKDVGLLADGLAYVVTAHNQNAYLDAGDWIIKESKGDGYYPCKPEIFETTYEPVI